VFLNVLTTPWGLANDGSVAHVALAVALVAIKILLLIAVIVGVESSFSKLRLFRISEYLAAAFVVSVTAMITEMLHL